MTEQQYRDELRKMMPIFDKGEYFQEINKKASGEEILELSKALPLIEGLGDLCYKECRYDEAYNLHYEKALITTMTLLERFRNNSELIQIYNRIRWKKSMADYHLAIEYWIAEQEYICHELHNILERGIWICANNPSNGILLTGINPSYVGNKQESFIPVSFNNCQGRYWNPLKKMIGSFALQGNFAYLDLFPLRVTKQLQEFEKFVPLDLKVAILQVTQNEIERLQPRLIIHANITSSFYWGTDIMHPWMGYKLSSLPQPESLREKGKLYRIDGFQKSDKIISSKDTTKLIGTLLFICPYQSGERSRLDKDKILREADILRLWNEYVEPNK